MIDILISAVRDGKWWVAEFEVEGHPYGTQARRLDQLEGMVRDAASLMTGKPAAEFNVDINAQGIPGEVVENYRKAAQKASAAEARLSAASRQAVSTLTGAGLSMRDVGALMGLSTQRVSQLAKA